MKKILSIDSGGIRGIIPAIILAEIEDRAGQPICELFDFFAGTSAGGMLVLGLTCPESYRPNHPSFCASEIVGIFYEWGHCVFKKRLANGNPGSDARQIC
jgi:patatin-like phospholipase/acyl hydrolase